MRGISLILAVSLALAGSAAAQPSYEDRRVERLAWPELQRFGTDREFRDYLREVRRVQRERRERRVEGPVPEIVVAQAEIDCLDPEIECPEEEDAAETVMVTGSRVAAAPSITNNQKAGVDEGDIVKRIGDYLLVLQDGRIFAVNFRTMTLTDRIDAYRKDEDGEPIGADWYDEMLVQGDHVVITAYSYYDDASELSIFRLDQATGRLERRGVFLITSDDYYDVDNYATRIVGDRLVIYTPYDPDVLAGRDWPAIRRWVPEEEFEDTTRKGRRILEARDIFRPVQGVAEPWVHTISVCPLGDVGERDLACDSTAFIAADSAEMFVSPDSVYLFTTAASDEDFWRPDYCAEGTVPRADPGTVMPGTVFRLPLRRGEPDLLPVRGVPFDQFSMDERDGRFRSLVNWVRADCDGSELPGQVALIDEPLRDFSQVWRAPPERRFTPLPEPGGGRVQNRFIGSWLVYGGRNTWGGRPPEPEEGPQDGFVQTVPLAAPSRAAQVPLGHGVTRLEALGEDAIVTGYRDGSGLRLSLLDLGRSAAVAGRAFLPRRFESESRSHAFNSIVGESGGGLMGVPTVLQTDDADRYPWYSETSDLSFLRFDPAGALSDLGAIAGKDEANPKPFYKCEVSCIDWYGNARPIFIEDGVFALMGTELVEVEAGGAQVAERRRLDLTDPPASR